MLPAHRFGTGRILAAALVLTVGGGILAQAAPGDAALIKSRQDKLRDLGSALKAVDDEIKKRSPDWDGVVIPNAQNVESRSSFLLKWFPKGTGPEAGVKTYALPAIWQKPDDFNRLGKAAHAEAAKLAQVAQGKDAGAVRAQVIATGKACKACHDPYRSPDYEKDAE